jgi:hypothetical protein
MKKFTLLMLLAGLFISTSAQEHRKDTLAVMLLDRMSTIIGDMSSCSFTLNTSTDIIDVGLGLVKNFNESQVYLKGPDKMLIHSSGYKGHRGFWYQGTQLVYYSYTENNYAIIETPDNIISTIDTLNKVYGIDFPAADFFYPTFTDDVIAFFDDIILAGRSKIDGKDCYHIVCRNEAMGAQIWISDDEWFLPEKFVIVYYDEIPNAQYEATFSGWHVNPDLPDAMFDFLPPPKAKEIKLMPRY